MTTVEKLNYLISIKSDIKTAIENKGVDMTGVSFLGYASKIGEIVSGVGYTDRDVIEARYQYNISNSASFVYSSAFEYKAVQTVDLSNCLYVGSNGFFYCTSLTTVNLPTCTIVYDDAFGYCRSLSQISLPMCSSIRAAAFAYCSSLSQISLPVCSYIGGAAFGDCYSLTQVSLPVCSIIRDYAFYNCSSLSIITIGYSGVCSLYSIGAFYGTKITSSTGSIYVPASLVDAYKSAENWSYFSSIIYSISQ